MFEQLCGSKIGQPRLAQEKRYRFSSVGYSAALETLLEATRQRDGFVVLTGSAGIGKTTLVEDLSARLRKDGCLLGKVSNCRVNAEELPQLIGFSFGLKTGDTRKAKLLVDLKERLVGESSQGQDVILIIDEAHDLSVAALDELHLLFDLIAGHGHAVHIILVGLERLRERLQQLDCAQVQQLVVASGELPPLSASETHAYVAHELGHLGWRGDPVISADAKRLIHERTGGVPRLINMTVGHLLLHGRMRDARRLEYCDVESVLEQIGKDHPALPLNSQQVQSLARIAPSEPPEDMDTPDVQDIGPSEPALRKRVSPRIDGLPLNSAMRDLKRCLRPLSGWDWKWVLAALSALALSVSLTLGTIDGDHSVPSDAAKQGPREWLPVAATTAPEQPAPRSADAPVEPNPPRLPSHALGGAVDPPMDVDQMGDLAPQLVEEPPVNNGSDGSTDVRENSRDQPTAVESAEMAEAGPPSAAVPEERNRKDDASNKISELLANAQRALSTNRLTVPSGDNAYAYYQAVLARDPNNAKARAGVQRIVQRYRLLAQRRLDKGEMGSARKFASRGLQIQPNDQELLTISRQAAEPNVASREPNLPELVKRIGIWFRSGDTTNSAFLDHDF